MKIAIVKIDDYSVASCYDAPVQMYGGDWGRADMYAHVEYDESVTGPHVKAQDDGQGGIEVIEDVQPRRNAKLQVMRSMRDAKMKEADIMINDLVTGDRVDTAAVQLYRAQLKGITDAYKDSEDPMVGTAALDALEDDMSDLSLPSAP